MPDDSHMAELSHVETLIAVLAEGVAEQQNITLKWSLDIEFIVFFSLFNFFNFVDDASF